MYECLNTRAISSGLFRHALGFLASTVFAVLGSLFLLIGSVIWTVIVKKAQDINTVVVSTTPPTSLGITVDVGNGLFLAWAAFACLIASVLPYMIRCVAAASSHVIR